MDSNIGLLKRVTILWEYVKWFNLISIKDENIDQIIRSWTIPFNEINILKWNPKS